MNQRDSALLLPVVLALLAAAAVLGSSLVEAGAVVYPLTLEFLVFAGVTAYVVRRERNPGARRFLGRLTVAAVAVRLGALLAVHTMASPFFFAPDTASYLALGEAVANHWTTGSPLPEAAAGWQRAYPLMNGAAHWLLGDPELAVSMVNLFAGVWTGVLAFHTGRELMGEAVGKLTAVLTSFFPSLILWSVLNVRDSITMLLVTLAVYLAVRGYRRGGIGRHGVLLAGVLLALSTLRDYMALLALMGILLAAATLVRPGRVGRTLGLGTVLILFLVFAIRQLGLFGEFVGDGAPLETAAQLREGLQTGGAVFGQGYEIDSLGGALRYLPVGMTYFLFAPFPWAITSILQLITVPEVVVWYLLFPVTLLGIRYALARGIRLNVLPLAVLLVIFTSYTLVQGNFGTAYRHRSQVMPLVFLFSAAGLIFVRSAWRGRKSRGRGRRRAPRVPPAPRGSP